VNSRVKSRSVTTNCPILVALRGIRVLDFAKVIAIAVFNQQVLVSVVGESVGACVMVGDEDGKSVGLAEG